jgi:hypothetical protein
LGPPAQQITNVGMIDFALANEAEREPPDQPNIILDNRPRLAADLVLVEVVIVNQGPAHKPVGLRPVRPGGPELNLASYRSGERNYSPASLSFPRIETGRRALKRTTTVVGIDTRAPDPIT